ncbi:hypothetical protein FAVG1_12881 [Fusarium avenaceum]|nr:hypothetical protein FAVG1_12881 [Fusarium avenaceum]
MAILPNVPGVSVRIIVNDEPAEEFTPPVGSALNSDIGSLRFPKVHRYIESQDGQSYSIEVSFDPKFRPGEGYDAVNIKITIDGNGFLRRRLSLYQVQQPGGFVCQNPTVRQHGDDGIKRDMQLCFSDLSTVEEADIETVQRDRERLRPVGSIQVSIFGVQIITVDPVQVLSTTQTASTAQTVSLEQDTSTEVALKAVILDGRDLTHSTTFKCIKTTAPSERPSDSRQSNTSTKDRLVGDFHFHYLSQDSLAAKGIIPCAQQAMPAYATDGGGAVPRQSNVSFSQGGKVMVDLTDEQD